MKRKIISKNTPQRVFALMVMGFLAFATLLFLYLTLAGKAGKVDERMPVSIGGNVFVLCLIWIFRDRYFSSSELKENGIENRCPCKPTVSIPWEKIEKVELIPIQQQTGKACSLLKVYPKSPGSARNAKAGLAREKVYSFWINELNRDLLQEYLPQRLKEMLSPHAFD